MLGNWIKATSTDTASPYTLTAVSGFPTPGDVFGENEPIGYMAEVVGGPNDGSIESGVGYLDGTGDLVVHFVLAIWVPGGSYTVNGSAATKTGASEIKIIVWPDLGSVMEIFSTVAPSNDAGIARAIHSMSAIDLSTSTFGWTNFSRVHYFPFLLGARIRCNGIYYRGGTSNESDVNVGLYSVRQDGKPFRKIVETGAFTHATGAQEAAWADSAVIHLSPGWYYIGPVTDNTGNLFYRHEIGGHLIGPRNGLAQAVMQENVSGVTLPSEANASNSTTLRTHSPSIALRVSG